MKAVLSNKQTNKSSQLRCNLGNWFFFYNLYKYNDHVCQGQTEYCSSKIHSFFSCFFFGYLQHWLFSN